ncbi:MAG: 50S ribosomal protein L14 [Microgenomates group bacterium GW2011_GWA1_48_10]|uniref:Large ribosomal subunit protein uL14 n=1 Tax=Candidatus Gottesmanbacteria bacterium RIFCSPHIGHO2_01_FULL_47_48 TaxID=1798381 RepID=A0A1F6A2H1_9BACT|nr:MAG: 50S ribosomal protein L14 [Microgenomates group bacterium GW2011_GWA1_48_10]OGG18871.1 MAG: 50S ribosomal protein L14 [Candidatus Gottesmanbacteria bacterium RIFCSPHIGHO2_01_FULL_47_48]
MIQRHTVLKPADNTGARKLRVIHLYGGSTRKFSYLGDVVKCVVDGANPNGMVKDSDMVFVVVVRVHKEHRRSDGSYIRFDDNAGVIINGRDNKDPVGTRVFGPVARELKDKGFNKIVSMASEVL